MGGGRKGERDAGETRREVLGVIGLGAALFLGIATISLQAHTMVMGPFGRTIASLFYGLAGVCGYFLIVLAAVAAVRMIIEREPVMPPLIVAGTMLGAVALATLIHLIVPHYRIAGHGPGGAIGEHLAEILRAVISTAGTALLACIGLVVAVVIATPLRMRDVLHGIGRALAAAGGALKTGAAAFAKFWADVFRAILPERGRDEDDDDEEVEEDDVLEATDDEHGPEPVIIERTQPSAIEVVELTEPKKKKKSPPKTMIDMAPPGPAANDEGAVESEPAAPKKRIAKGTKAPEIVEADDEAAPVVLAPAPAPVAANDGPLIVEPKYKHADKAEMAAKEKQAEAERQTFIKLGEGEYQLPSIQLLAYDASTANQIDKTAMLELSAKLTQTLENYGVKGDVVAIRPGPVVTMYEFAPAPGTRVNKIVNLTDDLALALEALRVRIVAPIPGKAAVGIEVPNRTREKVFLKEILADDLFRKGRGKLPMAIGKDIEGGPAVVDLARMPHLLVAGTTGSGKSVAVNAMITSLLYHCSPEDVRMIMVDPKMLELSIYEGVPHLLLPVVTDPKKANLALRWAVEEMERRYDLLAQMGVRDIASFNEKIGKQMAKVEADKLRAAADAAARCARGRSRQGRLRRLARGRRQAREDRHRAAPPPALHRRRDRRVRRPHDVRAEGSRDERRAHRAKGARRGHPPDPRDAAALGRRHHRPHQGELPVAHRVPRDEQDRLAHDPRSERCRGAARRGRHAVLRPRWRAPAPPRLLRRRGGDPPRRRVPQDAGPAGLQPRHRQAARRGRRRRRRLRRRWRRQVRRRHVRQGRVHRHDDAQCEHLVGPAPAAHRLQPRRAARRGDGEARRCQLAGSHEQARSAHRCGMMAERCERPGSPISI